MSSERRMSLAEAAGWTLAAAALVTLGVVWHFDRTRVWEIPHWDAQELVVLRAAEASQPFAEESHDTDVVEPAPGADPAETWAVAVNPHCAACRASLARAAAIRGLPESPVRLAVLVVDTPRRPSEATIASLAADELRWDSTGTWRRRWGHRIYGELLCFDRAGTFVRALPPLADSITLGHALRIGESLRREGGS